MGDSHSHANLIGVPVCDGRQLQGCFIAGGYRERPRISIHINKAAFLRQAGCRLKIILVHNFCFNHNLDNKSVLFDLEFRPVRLFQAVNVDPGRIFANVVFDRLYIQVDPPWGYHILSRVQEESVTEHTWHWLAINEQIGLGHSAFVLILGLQIPNCVRNVLRVVPEGGVLFFAVRRHIKLILLLFFPPVKFKPLGVTNAAFKVFCQLIGQVICVAHNFNLECSVCLYVRTCLVVRE
jgi:hypothetical protein